jgi:hypothetical protein
MPLDVVDIGIMPANAQTPARCRARSSWEGFFRVQHQQLQSCSTPRFLNGQVLLRNGNAPWLKSRSSSKTLRCSTLSPGWSSSSAWGVQNHALGEHLVQQHSRPMMTLSLRALLAAWHECGGQQAQQCAH